ncbi:Uncharacterised protein [Candidatus Gugararchaeum adminiculabundum]|nr:Uncharacterised protein [Candidatus Gugararchaeum adminiculabundum]
MHNFLRRLLALLLLHLHNRRFKFLNWLCFRLFHNRRLNLEQARIRIHKLLQLSLRWLPYLNRFAFHLILSFHDFFIPVSISLISSWDSFKRAIFPQIRIELPFPMLHICFQRWQPGLNWPVVNTNPTPGLLRRMLLITFFNLQGRLSWRCSNFNRLWFRLNKSNWFRHAHRRSRKFFCFNHVFRFRSQSFNRWRLPNFSNNCRRSRNFSNYCGFDLRFQFRPRFGSILQCRRLRLDNRFRLQFNCLFSKISLFLCFCPQFLLSILEHFFRIPQLAINSWKRPPLLSPIIELVPCFFKRIRFPVRNGVQQSF